MTKGATKCVLVGGPADGRRMEIPDHVMGVWIVERPVLKVTQWVPEPSNPVEVKHHQYLREFFSTPAKQRSIFRWSEIDLDQMSDMLLEGYMEPRI